MQHAILLTDDDRNILHGLARALRQQPYHIYTATSGEEAIHIIKSQNVDVVVADEEMPGMRGGELLAWIANNCPEVMRIVLTGRATADTAIRAINEGRVYQFFTKPCNPTQLAIAIREAMEYRAMLIARPKDDVGSARSAATPSHEDMQRLDTVVREGLEIPLRRALREYRELAGQRDPDKRTQITDDPIQQAIASAAQIRQFLDEFRHCAVSQEAPVAAR